MLGNSVSWENSIPNVMNVGMIPFKFFLYLYIQGYLMENWIPMDLGKWFVVVRINQPTNMSMLVI